MDDQPTSPRFTRDRLTWLCYLMIGNYCYTMGAMGPLMPFLRAELNLDYTTAAYHFSAWALGTLMAGMTGDRLMTRIGRVKTIWFCGGALATSTAVLLSAHNPVLTILASFFCGITGSTMGQSLNTIMSDRFGDERVIAITEANIVASICTSTAPLIVGGCARTFHDWRIALTLPIFFFFVMALNFRTDVWEPPKRKRMGAKSGTLPLIYWAYWSVILFSVASEWSLIFWSADFFEHVAKMQTADAAQAVSAFLVAMFVGRIIESRLARHTSLCVLLTGASIIAISGFMIFWLAPLAVLNITGLFIAGLGISNFYPLTLSAAIGTAPENTTVATARVSMASGTAVLLAPLVLGMVANRRGIFEAYGIIAALLVLAGVMAFAANRAASRHKAARSSSAEKTRTLPQAQISEV